MAFELFFGGTASRGQISSSGVSVSGTTLSFTLANAQNVVQFEVGMSLQASTTDGGAALAGSGSSVLVAQVASVNRGTGAITAVVIQDTFSSTWVAGDYLQVYGDIGTAGASTIAGLLGLSGLAAWVPSIDPISTDNFWGVNRSADPTRLGKLETAQIKPTLIDLELLKRKTRRNPQGTVND